MDSIFKLLDGLQRHLLGQVDVPSTSGAASCADLAPCPPKKPRLAEPLLSRTPEQIFLGVTQGDYEGMIVEEGSSRHDMDGAYYTDQNADHFTVCRAASVTTCTYVTSDYVISLLAW
ncbi:unnamed protein product [Calypogeia fissa]